jgi:hypothetical protein
MIMMMMMNKGKKLKVKLSRCLTNEGVWGSVCIYQHYLDLWNSWMWVVSFTSRPLYPRERASGTHCIGRWVDPRAGLDDMESENSWPYRDSNPDLSVVQPVASRYTDCASPAHDDEQKPTETHNHTVLIKVQEHCACSYHSPVKSFKHSG